jgi:hypothetical protein
MVEAYKANVIFPNKQRDEVGKTWKGHLLDGETYIGGHVEALQSGVFRSDLPVEFALDPAAFDELIGELEQTLVYALQVEGGMKRSEVTNFDAVLAQIKEALLDLRDRPKRREVGTPATRTTCICCVSLKLTLLAYAASTFAVPQYLPSRCRCHVSQHHLDQSLATIGDCFRRKLCGLRL